MALQHVIHDYGMLHKRVQHHRVQLLSQQEAMIMFCLQKPHMNSISELP